MDKVETMAYNLAGGVPWHTFGEPVDPDLTPAEMLVKAGLDWKVEKRPLYITNGGKLQIDKGTGLRTYSGKLFPLPDKEALVRVSDDSILTVVGHRWKEIQNEEAMEFFYKFVKVGMLGMETMGSLDSGRYIWGLARLNKSFKIGKKDENEGYLLLAHPHLFGQSFIIQTTAVRVVCWNTYSAALAHGGNRWSMRHSRKFDDVAKEEAEQAIGLAVAQFEEFGEMAKFLTKKKASDDWVKKYFGDVLGEKPQEVEAGKEVKDSRQLARMFEAYEQAPGADPGNFWGAFNAVTFVTDHIIGKDPDLRLSRAWFGDRSLMKRQALEKAMEYAQAA